ncbi:MAG: hypothetical protein RR744_00390 [Cellulosilyticaceae bacterium]
MKHNFRIGDIVVVEKYGTIVDGFVGKVGKIVVTESERVGVDFGERIYDKYGHVESNKLSGRLEERTGYFFTNYDNNWHLKCLVMQGDPEFNF